MGKARRLWAARGAETPLSAGQTLLVQQRSRFRGCSRTSFPTKYPRGSRGVAATRPHGRFMFQRGPWTAGAVGWRRGMQLGPLTNQRSGETFLLLASREALGIVRSGALEPQPRRFIFWCRSGRTAPLAGRRSRPVESDIELQTKTTMGPQRECQRGPSPRLRRRESGLGRRTSLWLPNS